ncbi:hypothetical protein HD806DRAFT_525844 [Xylariaceae sp. AK1471]|nr:hypothetical protein HD806DRAFT_525844 [Xylariaceae sp. AK1471]
MEDLRDAEHTVASFAKLIDCLQPDNPSCAEEGANLVAKRQDSTGSQKSAKSSISAISSRWRPKKRDWDESIEGVSNTPRRTHHYHNHLWNELEKPQSDVAQQFQVDQTALKEYISSLEMMDLGCEFARHHYGEPAKQKAYWAAEDLFFDLQAVKQGDADAGRWTGAKVYKKDWDLADHLVRFVLLAEQCRLCSGQEKWIAWEWSFPVKVGFYLSVLRCYTIRDAKQRQLARGSAGSPRSSHGSRSSKHDRLSPTT